MSKNLYEVLVLLKKSKLLKYIIFEHNDLKRIKNLEKISKSSNSIDFSTLLSLIIKEKNLLKVFNNLKLSNSEKEKIKNIINYQKKINIKEIESNLLKSLLNFGWFCK